MRLTKQGSPQSSLFLRYFLAFTLVILVPIVVFSLAFYASMSARIEQDLGQRLQNNADALRDQLDTLLIQLDGQVSRFSLELEGNDLIVMPLNTEQKMQRLAQLRKSLESSASTNPAIEVIGVYFGSDERVLSQLGYYASGGNLDWEPVQVLLSSQSMNGFHVYFNTQGELKILVARCIPIRLNKSRDFVYSTLDAREMGAYMQFGWTEATSYIVSEEERVLASSARQSLSALPGEDTLTAVARSGVMPWRYIVSVPRDVAATEISRMLVYLLLVMLLLCALGLFFSYMLAGALYRPINQLASMTRAQLNRLRARTVEQSSRGNDIAFISQTVTEIAAYSSALEQCLESGRSRVISSVFRHLLEGSRMERDEVEDILDNYSMPLEGRRFMVCLVEMRGEMPAQKWDGWLSRYSLENHMRTALRERADVDVLTVEMEKSRVCGVIAFPAQDPSAAPQRAFFEALLKSMALEWPQIRLCVGGVAEDVMAVSVPYQRALDTLSRLSIRLRDALIWAQDMPDAPQAAADLSPQWLGRLVNIVLAGDDAGAIQTLVTWYEGLSAQDSITLPHLRDLALHITGVIHFALQQTGGQVEMPPLPTIEELSTAQDAAAVMDRLMLYTLLAATAVQAEASTQSGSRVVRAVEYVNEHYTEDISLTQISDLLGVTPQYLSGAFKVDVGQNFTEYVNEKRLRAACDLLVSAKLPVQDIAAQVGYNSVQYFARKFKEAFGITPTQYRERSR